MHDMKGKEFYEAQDADVTSCALEKLQLDPP